MKDFQFERTEDGKYRVGFSLEELSLTKDQALGLVQQIEGAIKEYEEGAAATNTRAGTDLIWERDADRGLYFAIVGDWVLWANDDGKFDVWWGGGKGAPYDDWYGLDRAALAEVLAKITPKAAE
jgi:hypothetical protein